MTTTSDEIELRDPYANAYNPAAERARGTTYGAPRRRRERNQLLATVALIGTPLLVMGAIGATVISGYHSALADREAASAPATAKSAQTVPADPDAELIGHAPTGADVGTSGLTPGMTRAIDRARAAAAADGITIDIVSGYRTAATQQQLFDQAITKYGSAAAASEWVLPPDKSEHVTGGAVDVGPFASAKWLEKNGVQFGLCRRYANEYWHFELLAPAKGQKCPALVANAASGG